MFGYFKTIILISTLSITSLVGCSDADSSYVGSASSVTSQTTNMTSETEILQSDLSETPKPEYKTITAEVTGYQDGKLMFCYEGRDYAIACEKEKFAEDSPSYYPTLTERIIYNRFGEKVKGKLKVSSDMSEIISCDVVKPNGQIYMGMNPIGRDKTVDRDLLYSLKREEGSRCMIKNNKETLELDLNDLEQFWKLDYSETIEPVIFYCYRFSDGKTFLYRLIFNVTVESDGLASNITQKEIDGFGKRLCFFGTVKSISADGSKLTFLLNDKKTVCTVPTFFSDGAELSEDMKIMVTLNADSDLFGSGGEHSFDYAVISANQEYINQTGEKDIFTRSTVTVNGEMSTGEAIAFDKLAYAKYKGVIHFEYTTVDKCL